MIELATIVWQTFAAIGILGGVAVRETGKPKGCPGLVEIHEDGRTRCRGGYSDCIPGLYYTHTGSHSCDGGHGCGTCSVGGAYR